MHVISQQYVIHNVLMEGVLLMKQLEVIIVHVMLDGQEKHVTMVRLY